METSFISMTSHLKKFYYFIAKINFLNKKVKLSEHLHLSVTSPACRKNNSDAITQENNYTTKYAPLHSGEWRNTERKTVNKKAAAQYLAYKNMTIK